MESVFLRRAPNNIGSAFSAFARSEITRMKQRLGSMARLMQGALLLTGMTSDGQSVDMKYP
jgi:hypothetical protein